MSESLQVMPSAKAGAPQAKASSIDSATNTTTDSDAAGFTAVFASYVEPETSAAEQNVDENLTELLAALLPQDGLESGNTLPQADQAAIWQAFMQMQPTENGSAMVGMAAQAQDMDALAGQRKPALNPHFLTQDYFNTFAKQSVDSGLVMQQGMPVQNISNQLAAAHFNPLTNEALLLDTNEQFVPVQAGNSSSISALASVGLGTATQAAATQTQMAPLNLGQNAWENNLGSRLQMMVGQNIQSAEIRLDPPELGALDIKIKVTNDVATVNITSAHAQVKEALESAIPRLREMFAESGVALGDVNVQQESFAQQENSAEEMGENPRFASNSEEDEQAVTVSHKVNSNNLLDIYA